MTFSKWEGLGNDFVVLDAREGLPPEPGQLAQQLCDRHFGVGADGLAFLTKGNGSAFGMEIYNADGSHAMMCGNALRCLAALASRDGFAPPTDWMVIQTASGEKRARITRKSPWEVEVDMGLPVALNGRGVTDEAQLELAGVSHRAFLTSMGNPHLVIPVEDFEGWERHGALLEKGPLAPVDGINVEFVKIDPDRLTVKVWERGAGPTLACGTGACATVVALADHGLAPRACLVSLPGGDLHIDWQETVFMRGPAREVFRGEWNP